MKGQTGLKLNKFILGVTGNSGSGKTTVCKILQGMDFHAIDCDVLAHTVMLPGQQAYNKIVETFGLDILANSGEIDRKKMGTVIFSDVNKRSTLESIVHPAVIEMALHEAAATDCNHIAIDAVLLVESGLHHHCDAVWLVTASEDQRLSRIIARDGLSQEAAQARMRNQRDTSHIETIAQAVIVNYGDLESLQKQVKSALQKRGE